MSERQLLEAIAVTAEMTGTVLSPAAARAMFEELRRYPENQVLGSLNACRRELRNRLTLADVLQRLDDGRPGPEEAWSVVVRTQSEDVTVVWTEEMRLACGIAWPLIASHELVAARMAFIETYRKMCQQARDAGNPVKWTVSLGHDVSAREGPLRIAVEKGLLLPEVAQSYLPLDVELPKNLLPQARTIVKQFPPL